MPGPHQAVYNATKSFVQSLAEALQVELKDAGVSVTSLMPGPTSTEFFERGHLDDTPMGRGPQDDPADVARQGFEALMAGKRRVVAASLMTRVIEASNKVLPDRVEGRCQQGHGQAAAADASRLRRGLPQASTAGRARRPARAPTAARTRCATARRARPARRARRRGAQRPAPPVRRSCTSSAAMSTRLVAGANTSTPKALAPA